ncbi:MAG: hypothetical protein Q7J73_08615 [Dehalococcoidales bacterium]|nr:hypothetical protein [Dehalococcoidales bacterium]
MAKVNDAREAEAMVRSLYPSIADPQPYNFETHKQGYTWIVKYNLLSVIDTKKHEVRINAITGKMVRIQ